MSRCLTRMALPMLAAAWAFGAGPAHATDKFKVTTVDCEQFWQWKHTPVIHYDIVPERRTDYETNPPGEYFAQAAVRTADYCDRTSVAPSSIYNPPRKIRGIWFQSNDGMFKVLYDLDHLGIEASVAVVNTIGERHAAAVRTAAEHQAQLDEINSREARAREVKEAEEKAARDKLAAENAREAAFFGSRDLQATRLGAPVTAANITNLDAVRVNPFHFQKLGVTVVRTQFNRMVNEKVALFGNELAPVFVHITDVDRFTRSGETVLLAFRVIERGEVERSYGTLPEALMSLMKSEPIFGDYVGAYTCPGDDCTRVFDAPPT